MCEFCPTVQDKIAACKMQCTEGNLTSLEYSMRHVRDYDDGDFSIGTVCDLLSYARSCNSSKEIEQFLLDTRADLCLDGE